MAIPQTASQAKTAAQSHGLEVPVCPGHGQTAKRTVSKTPSNNGRAFYSCAFRPSSCDYFQWEDKLAGYQADGVTKGSADTSSASEAGTPLESKAAISTNKIAQASPAPAPFGATPAQPIASGSGSNHPRPESREVATVGSGSNPTTSSSLAADAHQITPTESSTTSTSRTTRSWNSARQRLLAQKKIRPGNAVKNENNSVKDENTSPASATISPVSTPTAPVPVPSPPVSTPAAPVSQANPDIPTSTSPASMATPTQSTPRISSAMPARAPSSPLTPPPDDPPNFASSLPISAPATATVQAQSNTSSETAASHLDPESTTVAPLTNAVTTTASAPSMTVQQLSEAFGEVASRWAASQSKSQPTQAASGSKRPAQADNLSDPEITFLGERGPDSHRDKRQRTQQDDTQERQEAQRRLDGTARAADINSDHLPVALTNPTVWRYLSEGGANVVFVYTGTDPVFLGKVLRIRKQSAFASREEQSTNDYWHDWLLPDVFEAVSPGARGFLPAIWRVKVRPEWIETLDFLTWTARPEARRVTGAHLEPESLVVVTENVIGGKAQLAIELKPKAGYVPVPHGLDPRYAEIKTSVCKYCMKRTSQLPPGKACRYAFCPVDLYSNQFSARFRALDCLTESWKAGTAGNNMRVFVDGELLKPDDPPRYNLDYRDPASLTTLLHDALSDSQILDVLAETQKRFDLVDIQAIGCIVGPHSNRPDQPFDLVNHRAQTEEITKVCQNRFRRDATGQYVSPHMLRESEDLRSLCVGISLAAIVRDCSIILRWNLAELAGRVPQSAATVQLVDLDLKPMANLNKWWKQDQDLCKAIRNRALAIPCGAGGSRGYSGRSLVFPRYVRPDLKEAGRVAALNTELLRSRTELEKSKKDSVTHRNEATQLRERNAQVERALNRMRRELDSIGYM
ncbi:inositol-pentakisphosphate 2-kinase-domain-containing protein [Filobasidium floriforme]|uniref:inositol-pentakisphosphate 2-kinase-domain-containing protein n=1 Tax=Filobasidium floriforme TaxID=5210 RepID=UPI001E8CEDD8|nr:inositol-pentakisphosphate 2-kinase-domain-containing protein [Filobasidium floriforme]KAH8079742.1 inositol-pentakisphosphate 2-kinase-domain-containing protein [Filobasidium floriforme]